MSEALRKGIIGYMKSKILILIVLVFLLVTAVTIRDSLRVSPGNPDQETPLPPGGEMIACTMDAMMCPDGSYVGRTGPNCQFVCPSGTTTPASTDTFEARLNATTTFAGKTLVVKEILEDSRCPIDVVCIQAGTVRIKVLVSRVTSGLSEQTMTLSVSSAVDDKSLELINVTPVPKAGVPITKADYRFTFKVSESVPQAI